MQIKQHNFFSNSRIICQRNSEDGCARGGGWESGKGGRRTGRRGEVTAGDRRGRGGAFVAVPFHFFTQNTNLAFVTRLSTSYEFSTIKLLCFETKNLKKLQFTWYNIIIHLAKKVKKNVFFFFFFFFFFWGGGGWGYGPSSLFHSF